MTRLRKLELTDATSGVTAKVNDSGEVETVMSGIVDENNTTTTPLGAGATFTGEATEVLNYAMACVNIHCDEASAVNGLKIEKSIDGSDWVFIDEMTINAGAAKEFSYGLTSKYFRVVYTNGVTPQTHFDLSVVLKKTNQKPSSHRIQDSIVDDDDAELVKAVNTGIGPDGIYRNVNTTVDGDLQISDNSSGLSIAQGNVTGHSAVQKFGAAPDFDSADGEVTIWDGASDASAWELMRYVYSTTADIDSISSDNAADTIEMTVIGLDTNYNEVTQTATLSGQTRVALTTPLLRVYRAYNSNSVNFVGHVVVYVNTALTAGIPTDKTKIRAVINPTAQQTLMAVYTVPAGKTAYLKRVYASTAGGSKATNYISRLYTRSFGGVFRLQNIDSISSTATSIIVLDYFIPLRIEEKTDLEVTIETTESPITGSAISAGFDLVLVDN